ncbi:KH domain-containing protein [Cryptosporidium felis]|nr:KH domain-containing protein [Cryptosporidium felis]
MANHSDGLEGNSLSSVSKVGPIEKKQKGKLRSGPTNSSNQKRSGTRFSNNPNIQGQPHLSPSQTPTLGASVNALPIQSPIPGSIGNLGMVNPSLLKTMGVAGNVLVTPPISQASQQSQVVSYRNTKKIPIDRSKFHPSISNLAGAIIGVSGSNQKWMEQESGAQVQILGTTGNDPEGLHILVRYNEQRELEIVEAIIDEIGRATFEGGGGFISHILPNRKPVSPTLTGLQENVVSTGVIHGNAQGVEKQILGNSAGIGGMAPLPPNFTSSQQLPIYNTMGSGVGMGFVPRGMASPIQIEWPKTPPASPVEFEWLLHLVLHSALSRLGPMVSHGVPMIHIPMLYDSFTSFRFEHDATSFFQSYIVQNGLLGLIQALPHIFIEGPHTIINSSNIPKLSPIFKVNLSSGVTPLLLPAQSVSVSFSDFKLAAEAFWKMGALPPTFSGFGLQLPQSLGGIGPSDHSFATGVTSIGPNYQKQQQNKDLTNTKKNEGESFGKKNKTDKNVALESAIPESISLAKTGNFVAEDESPFGNSERPNSKTGGGISNGASPTAPSSFSSTTTTASTSTVVPLTNVGRDNIPHTSLMIVLQGVHYLLRRWISERLAPHYIPKSSLDFLPLDILESEFSRFYDVPLNIEILGWTNLLHFVEAFPEVWTVENVGPDEFTLIPVPYPDFSMIAKSRGITKSFNRPVEPNFESNSLLQPQKNNCNSLESMQRIVKQTQDFVLEAISSGYPANSLEINSINEIIHNFKTGLCSLDNNTSSSLYELVTKITNSLPNYSSNSGSNPNSNNGFANKINGGMMGKSRFDNAGKVSVGPGGITSGSSKGIDTGGYRQYPHLQQPQPIFGPGNLPVPNDTIALGNGLPLNSGTVHGTSRFNSAKNEPRYDIGTVQQITNLSQHGNIHIPHQANSQVSNVNPTGRPANGGQSKRVFSSQCSGVGAGTVIGAGKGSKQLAGQDQISYQYFDQQNSHQSPEFSGIQHHPASINSGHAAFAIQNVSGIHGYYNTVDGGPHFSSFNGAPTNGGMNTTCHLEYQSFGAQPHGSAAFVQQHNPQNYNINSSYAKPAVIPQTQSLGNNNGSGVLLPLSGGSTGAVSSRSGWDRKNKSKN